VPPADNDQPGSKLPWHRAIVYALIGRIEPALGEQERPTPASLVADLDRHLAGGRAELLSEVARARQSGGLWPIPLPTDLRAALGPAQFAAALTETRRLLGLGAGPTQVLSARPPDAAERAMLREVPPHHGT
jgi:hypothetical protein